MSLQSWEDTAPNQASFLRYLIREALMPKNPPAAPPPDPCNTMRQPQKPRHRDAAGKFKRPPSPAPKK